MGCWDQVRSANARNDEWNLVRQWGSCVRKTLTLIRRGCSLAQKIRQETDTRKATLADPAVVATNQKPEKTDERVYKAAAAGGDSKDKGLKKAQDGAKDIKDARRDILSGKGGGSRAALDLQPAKPKLGGDEAERLTVTLLVRLPNICAYLGSRLRLC